MIRNKEQYEQALARFKELAKILKKRGIENIKITPELLQSKDRDVLEFIALMIIIRKTQAIMRKNIDILKAKDNAIQN